MTFVTGYYVFTGEDGSLGYHKGVVYSLTIDWTEEAPTITWPFTCPYSSTKAFEDNWHKVRGLESVLG